MSVAHALILALFLLFFGLICPIFIYWFNHFLKTAWTGRESFIGFPQDRGPRS
jgi:hypothetical protein